MKYTRSRRRKSIGKRQEISIKRKNQCKKRRNFEAMRARFASASEKRHDESDAAIRDQQLIMKEHKVMMKDL